jgi:hypothetical protein
MGFLALIFRRKRTPEPFRMQPPCPECGSDLFEGDACLALGRGIDDGHLHTKVRVTCARCKSRLWNKDDGPWQREPAERRPAG